MSRRAFYGAAASALISLILISILSPIHLTYGDSIVDTIPVGNHPFLLEFNPANNNIYVTNVLSGTVSVIDSSTNTVIATIPVGDHPQALEFNPSNNNIYVANLFSSTVSVIDSSTNTVIATIPVGTAPTSLEFNPANNNIYVGSNPVYVIRNLSVNATISNVGPNPRSVEYNPFNDNIYIATFPVNTVSVINSSTNTVIATIPVGTSPGPSLEFNPANNDIYVGTFIDRVLVIDSSTNTVRTRIPVGNQALGIVFNPFNDNIYVTAGNTVPVIDSSTNTVRAIIPVGTSPSPFGLEFNPSNNNIYVANQGSGTVSVIDSSNNTVIDTIPVGNNPRSLEFNPSNDNIYVTNTDDDTVSVISTAQNDPPDCRGATPSESIIWPLRPRDLANITITGITDPDGDTVTTQITTIYQDEPTVLRPGDPLFPDGAGVGTEIAQIRAERDPKGDGRVYHIGLEASDGKKNGTCSGEVIVSVPHDLRHDPVDSGVVYDSTR